MNQINVDIQQTTQEIGVNIETGSGIISVTHDNTLTGSGTLTSPLGVDTSLFATAEQGGKADTAVQPSELATVATTGEYSDLLNTPSLATVATSGSYNDLSDKPTIPAAQVQSDWNASSGVAAIANKPTLATVATSGSYNDLSNKPTIPTTASDVGALAITGGTATGTIEAPAFMVVKGSDTHYYIDTASTYYLRIGTGTSISGNDLLIRTGTNRFLAFGSGDGGSLGSSDAKWGVLYSIKINNGADIDIPNTAGTMVVATPPTTDGTYVLKAVVSDGEVTYSWVAE